MMAERSALLVGHVLSGLAVALRVYFVRRSCATAPHTLLRRSEKHDALDVAVDEAVIIILLKDLGS
jgi:hypothetical protein